MNYITIIIIIGIVYSSCSDKQKKIENEIEIESNNKNVFFDIDSVHVENDSIYSVIANKPIIYNSDKKNITTVVQGKGIVIYSLLNKKMEEISFPQEMRNNNFCYYLVLKDNKELLIVTNSLMSKNHEHWIKVYEIVNEDFKEIFSNKFNLSGRIRVDFAEIDSTNSILSLFDILNNNKIIINGDSINQYKNNFSITEPNLASRYSYNEKIMSTNDSLEKSTFCFAFYRNETSYYLYSYNSKSYLKVYEKDKLKFQKHFQYNYGIGEIAIQENGIVLIGDSRKIRFLKFNN